MSGCRGGGKAGGRKSLTRKVVGTLRAPKLPHTECAGYSEVPLASDGQTGATGEGEGGRSVRRAATDPKFRATGFPFRPVGNMGRGGGSARAVGPAAGCRKRSQSVGPGKGSWRRPARPGPRGDVPKCPGMSHQKKMLFGRLPNWQAGRWVTGVGAERQQPRRAAPHRSPHTPCAEPSAHGVCRLLCG